MRTLLLIGDPFAFFYLKDKDSGKNVLVSKFQIERSTRGMEFRIWPVSLSGIDQEYEIVKIEFVKDEKKVVPGCLTGVGPFKARKS